MAGLFFVACASSSEGPTGDDPIGSSSGGEASSGLPGTSSGAAGSSSGGASGGASSGSSGLPASCSDDVKNGDETDVDCGGACEPCGAGRGCTAADDCDSEVCSGAICQAPACDDQVKNGSETDVDCGGNNCALCVPGKTCSAPGDCDSGVCTGGVCATPTNGDGVKNGNETDIDCGSGPVALGVVDTGAAACDDLATCLESDDCQSALCLESICQVPTCTDTVRNGGETDVDCGGPSCAPCLVGAVCALARDCDSGVCENSVCKAPTNNDGVKNGNETDVDCGSGGAGVDTNAPVCRNLQRCVVATDCHSGVCNPQGLCAVPTNNDGVKNGNETDVDCGSGPLQPAHPVYGAIVNTAAPTCANGRGCVGDDDCSDNVCNGLLCRPKLQGYTDGRRNGDETDVDCGGAGLVGGTAVQEQSRRCVAGQSCNNDGDCKSDACYGNRCELARSCTMHHGGDTCGTGDETWPVTADGQEPAMNMQFKKHESCCTSVVVNRPAGEGGDYRLDKYAVTAGRMRTFLRVLANTNSDDTFDNANVQAWVAAARALVDAPSQLPTAHDNWRPTAWNAPVPGVNNCGSDGTQPCRYGWVDHLSGYRFNNQPGGEGGFGCFMGATSHGSRTFHFGDNRYRARWGEGNHNLSRQRLDQKALNCVTYVMLAAFCAWDGGRLETREEHDFAYGPSTYPWGTEQPVGFSQSTNWQSNGPNWTTGATPNAQQLTRFLRANWSWNYGHMVVLDVYNGVVGRQPRGDLLAYEPAYSQASDQSFAVAPPGRYPLGERGGIRDLAGNLMEITATPQPLSSTSNYRWSKNGSFEGWTHTPNGVGVTSYNFNVLTKYGRTGGRCARPIDGYPAQRLPKR